MGTFSTARTAAIGLLALASLACPTRTVYDGDGGVGAGGPGGRSQAAAGGRGAGSGAAGSGDLSIGGGSGGHGGAAGMQPASGGVGGSSVAGSAGSNSSKGSGGAQNSSGGNLGTGGPVSSSGGAGGGGGAMGFAGASGGQGGLRACQAASDCISGLSCVAGHCSSNGFSGSPCIMNLDGTELVYAHGVDTGIYSRFRVNGSWSAWSKVQLDGSLVAPASGIGCSEGQLDVKFVGLSTAPRGELLYSEGNSVQFGAFQHELGTETFNPLSASISAAGDGSYLVGAMDGSPQLWMVNSGNFTMLTPLPNQTNAFVSAIDVALQLYNPVSIRMVAGFEASGQLGVYGNVLSMGSGSWNTPLYVSPPRNHVYAFAPAICADTNGTHHDVHVVVATEDGQIWDSYVNELWGDPFSPWELVGHGAASSLDCTIMSDSTVRAATLDATGRVIEVQGSPGSWTQTDLGVY